MVFLGFVLLLCVAKCKSFLFDQTTPQNKPSTNNSAMTDTHYYTLLGALSEERTARLKLEDQQKQLEEVVKQLYQELKVTKNMINETDVTGSFGLTVNETDMISLRKEFEIFQIMQNQMYDYLKDVDRNVSALATQLESSNSSLYQSQIDNIKTNLDNTSVVIDKLLNGMNNILSLENLTKNIYEKINIFEVQIENNFQNKTVDINSALNVVATNVSNIEAKLNTDFKQLVDKHDEHEKFISAQLQNIEQESSMMSSRIALAENWIMSQGDNVVLTACANGGNYFDGLIIPFVTMFSKGISATNQQLFKHTGKFFAEKSGIYLFNAQISSQGTAIRYHLMKDNDVVTSVAESIPSNDQSFRTTSASSAVNLSVNGTLWIKANTNMNLVQSVNKYSCINIIAL